MTQPCTTSQIPLVLFHGLLSSPQEFGLMAHAMRSHGIVHHAVTIPSYTLANDITSPDWKTWLRGAHQAIEDACPGDGPIMLGGLCMGGILAAATALTSKRKIVGVVLMSPTFEYDGWGMSPLRHLRHMAYWTGIDRFFSVNEREPFGVKNEKIRRWIKEQMQDRAISAVGPARMPLRALREADRMLRHVRAQLADLQCPLLMIHAREDEITTLGSVQRVFDTLPVTDKQLCVLENSYHMITIDNDRRLVTQLLDRFVHRITEQEAAKHAVPHAVSYAVRPAATRPVVSPQPLPLPVGESLFRFTSQLDPVPIF